MGVMSPPLDDGTENVLAGARAVATPVCTSATGCAGEAGGERVAGHDDGSLVERLIALTDRITVLRPAPRATRFEPRSVERRGAQDREQIAYDAFTSPA
jgi:hypothetical protein